jgi:uncharacterized protein YbaR (Trm112 family)
MHSSINQDLIAMIRCPLTKSSLILATDGKIEQLNSQIDEGTLFNQVGQKVTAKIDSGFVNEDSTLLLPVRGGIVILITDQAIPLSTSDQ